MEFPTNRRLDLGGESNPANVQPRLGVQDTQRTAPLCSPYILLRSESFLTQGEPDEGAPPSGGAASRANTSFARTTSFVTATEGDLESHSISSSNLPSPISPIGHGSPPQQDSLPVDLLTQDWREFLDSTQGRAIDDVENHPQPDPTRSLPVPNRVLSPAPEVLLGDSVSREDGVFRINFKAKDVPSGATKLWAVKRGLVPGFHFQEPLIPDLSQSRAFHEMRFETWDLTGANLDRVIAEANAYMNHQPEYCRQSYRMCYQDCSSRLQQVSRVSKGEATGKLPDLACERRCNGCDLLLNEARAVLCENCAFGSHPDPDLGLTVSMFSLCEERASLLKQSARGHNIFYTGAAGTGKSTVLRAMVYYLSRKSIGDERLVVEVASPTGITALKIGGKTIHMFAGWGLKAEKYPLKRLKRHACKRRNWIRLSAPDVLIIDEVSMVSNFKLTRLDHVMRSARHQEHLPFGGVQVIITGDFFQLPPVK